MRSELLDRRLGPFENLATNPRLKRCVAGSTVFKRNLATNPIFARAVSGTNIVRRNLCTNPVPTELNTVGYGFSAPGWSVIDSDQPLLPSTFVGYEDWTPPQYAHLTYSVSGLIVGATYTASLWAIAGVLGMQMRVSPASNLSGANTATTSVGVVNELVRYKITFVATATTIYVGLFSTSVSPGSGVVGMTGILVEQRPTVLPYFDGDTPDELGFTYEWEGTPGASTSVIKTASVEVRRNFVPAPRGSTGLQGTNTAHTTVDSGGPDAGSFGRLTFTSARSVTNGNDLVLFGLPAWGGQTLASVLPVLPSTTYTASVYVRSSRATTVRLQVQSIAGDTGGVAPTPDRSGDVVLTPGQWSRLSVTFTTPATGMPAARLDIDAATSTSFLSGDTLDVTMFLVEQVSAVLPYFDGSMTPDADLMPAWTGTANASESILRGISPKNTYIMNNAKVYLRPSDNSLRITSTAGPLQLEGWMALAGSANTLSGLNVTFIPGRTYTAIVKVKPNGANTYPWANTAKLNLAQNSIAGWTGSTGPYSDTTIDLSGGVQEIRYTFTISANSIWAILRLSGSGHISNPPVDVLSFALIENGAYSGPIFHGDTDPGDTGIVYEWEGTEHDSASVMKVGVVEVRRNLFFTQPAPGSGWAGHPGTGGAVVDTDENGMARTTWTTAATGGSPRLASPTTTVPVTPGDVLTLSADVAASGQVILLADWLLDNTWVALSTSAPVTPSASTLTPTRMSFTATVPPGVNRLRFFVRWTALASATVGAWIAAGRVLVERAPIALPYFDGYTSPDGDLSPAWLGVGNASASALYGIAPLAVDGYWPTRSRRFLSFGGGVRSMRMEAPGNAGFIIPNVPIGASGETISAIVECIAPFGGSIYLQTNTGGLVNGQVVSASAVPQTLRLYGAAPAGQRLLGIALYAGGGALGDNLFTVLRLTIVRGRYEGGNHFDGDDDRVIWRGTPHGSASIGYPIPV